MRAFRTRPAAAIPAAVVAMLLGSSLAFAGAPGPGPARTPAPGAVALAAAGSSAATPDDLAAPVVFPADPDEHEHDLGAAGRHDEHEDGADHGPVRFREGTPEELAALGLQPGTGACAGLYDSLPTVAGDRADGRPYGAGPKVCTHGPDFVATPALVDAAAGLEPGAYVFGAELDPTYAPKGIPCYAQSGPLVHVYYGYPSGGTNRLAALAPQIREAIARADDIYARSAAQAGRVRHVRWKMSSCQVVITAVPFSSTVLDQELPGPIRRDLINRGLMSTAEKGLVFTDETSCFPGLAGIAELAIDERASSSNINNQGGTVARVFGCAWTAPQDVPVAGYYAAHELTHTLGAVQDNSPNSSSRTGGRSHCTDGDDVMCYDDGGGEPRAVCPATYPSYLDCNKDDYFSPVPVSGSYIATHWNTASNQFLATAAAASEQALPRPSATLTSPSAAATVSGTVPLAATAATASDGKPIIQVEFWANGDLVSIDTSAPYTATLSTLFTENGGYPNGAAVKVVALAVDSVGRIMPSAVRTLTIANPRVRLTAPSPYATSTTGTVGWAASASSGAGLSVTKVEVLDYDVVVATDTSAPYAGTLHLDPGAHLLVARVTDSRGTTRDGDSRQVDVVDPAPVVTMVAPSPWYSPTVVAGSNQRLAAAATASSGRTITGVTFYADGIAIPGTATLVNGAWELASWIPGAIGSPQITARATDSAGASTTSEGATIYVGYDGPPSAHPAVNLTAPSDGATITGGVTMAATPALPSGWTVDSVAFLVDGNWIGEDTTAPYSMPWTNDGVPGPRSFMAEILASDGSFNQELIDSREVVARTTALTTLAITSPANGANLKGEVTVDAAVSNPDALFSDPFLVLGGADTYLDSLYAPDYSTTFYSPLYENGTTTLRAQADVNGGLLSSAPVTVNFRNTAISQGAPAAGATVASKIALTATATGTYAVIPEEVRFRIDGVVVGRDSTSPYAVSWNPASVATGSHTTSVEMTMTDGAVYTTATRSFTVSRTPTVTRLAGTDRYATAVAISKASFPGVPVSAVYIATGTSFPDALAGAPVAGRDGVPLLLVTPTAIPSVVATELTRLKPAKIVILGGTGAVSDAVKSALDAYTTGSVTRLAGADRYSTAVAISKASFAAGVPAAYIATGGSFPDALAGAPVAGRDGVPLLLVTPTAIPAVVATELTRLKPGRIVILGGTGAVSDSVKAALDAYTTGTVTRLSGSDRYATAVAISKASFTSPAGVVYIATGASFPDALAGAPVAGDRGAPLLLVTQSAIPASVQAELVRLKPKAIIILGGTGAVSDSVKSALVGYLVP